MHLWYENQLNLCPDSYLFTLGAGCAVSTSPVPMHPCTHSPICAARIPHAPCTICCSCIHAHARNPCTPMHRLIKAGALTDKDKALESQLSKISAWSEFIGYMSNLWLSCIKVWYSFILSDMPLGHRKGGVSRCMPCLPHPQNKHYSCGKLKQTLGGASPLNSWSQAPHILESSGVVIWLIGGALKPPADHTC